MRGTHRPGTQRHQACSPRFPASTTPRSHQGIQPGQGPPVSKLAHHPARARNGTAPATVGRKPAFIAFHRERWHATRPPERACPAMKRHARRRQRTAMPMKRSHWPCRPGRRKPVSICQSGDLPRHRANRRRFPVACSLPTQRNALPVHMTGGVSGSMSDRARRSTDQDFMAARSRVRMFSPSTSVQPSS